jgi:DNA-binding PadR family transcriptional regulator/catechol 2,3-dioxygenase-like lactoylglutathione lyase family enzyme
LLAAWLLVLVEGGVSHGYDMRRELAARRLDVDHPSVYRMLKKLQRDGHVRSSWGKTVAGPRRRLYEITPEGLTSLAHIARRLTAISQTHELFFEAYEQAGLRERPPAPEPPKGVVDLLALDHLVLSVEDPEAMQAFLCAHLQLKELARSADSVLVGADERATKLSLIPAAGPREPAALRRLVLGVADLQHATALLPTETEVQRQGPHSISFEGPENLGLGLARTASGAIDHDISHVILRVADPEETASALAGLGWVRRDGALHVAATRITLEELPAWSDRPLLERISVRAGSIRPVAAQARRRGFELSDSAPNTVAVVLPGPERITCEFVADQA